MKFTITTEEQKILLTQAREVIIAELERRKPNFAAVKYDNDSNLNTPCGAFISLHINSANGRKLRGCIGRMTANLSLIETVRLMAREAAFGDPRFPPLKIEELPKLHIEISALSPMSPCLDYKEVKVGVHGLLLTGQGRSGVLLPQVPVEQGWNQNEYLDYICVKAGLPPESYKNPKNQLYTFTAVVFSED
ncbi:MAG: AmmeMemoRadiSam system protein A [Treponema sp.]|nr:AmmeMemoRadiSam system protein A [Treponema sp.]